MRLRNLQVSQIYDSRAEATLEVTVTNQRGGEFFAEVASGRSRGVHEAAVLDFNEALAIIERISSDLEAKDFSSPEEFDQFLVETVGGRNNLTSGASVAAARAFAESEQKPLWQYLADVFFSGERALVPPRIFANLVNGGVHTKNNLAIQEYLLIVRADGSLSHAVADLIRIYKELGKRFFNSRVILGDEGGFAPDFTSDLEPLKILDEAAEASVQSEYLELGIDAAASNFYQDGKYQLGGESLEAPELAALYAEYSQKLPRLVSFEDPFAENDLEGFQLLRRNLPDALVVGDDLTVTDATLIEKYAEGGLVNGVIIKPNQIGTVSDTCRAILTAHKRHLKTIVSHRSGETADDFIIELARAGGVYGVKIGAPIRERIYKYNTLLRLYSS